MNKKFIESPLYRWLLLIYFFLTVFFPLGLYTLLAGPSKWVIEVALRNSWTEYHEKIVQRSVILGVILFSIFLAIVLRKLFLSGRPIIRYSILLFFSVLFLISIYIFSFKPHFFISLSGGSHSNLVQTTLSDSGANIEFVLGAYPDLKELRRLKQVGYTGVVSLLDEMVVPAEPNLIREENENAQKVGIQLIHIPMMPWVSRNNESISKIQKLAREGHGKYFVHCYLGRDRVNVFRKIVRDIGVKSKSLQKDLVRHIEDLRTFERGPYTKLDKNIYLTPFPTDDEFFGYIVNGQISSVVSILDPKSPDDKVWILREKKILSPYGVNYISLPILDEKDAKAIRVLIDSLPKIKQPIIIHKYSSSDPLYKVLVKKLKVVEK
ncbi:MAG TPA: hypothetical protein VJ602_11450 [Paludibacter sp.]|nr:hypothetical protein [Paludibacter sp.]